MEMGAWAAKGIEMDLGDEGEDKWEALIRTHHR
jgi:hypothetical protein